MKMFGDIQLRMRCHHTQHLNLSSQFEFRTYKLKAKAWAWAQASHNLKFTRGIH